MSPEILRICIFCGSSLPDDSELEASVRSFLTGLFELDNIEIVYGGAKVGLMGVVADMALKKNIAIHGIMPTILKNKEVAHRGLTSFTETRDMHERKILMYKKSDTFIVLPGGFGTLDELFEVMTWRQLGVHQKDVFLLDANSYFTPLREQIGVMFQKGFISRGCMQIPKFLNGIEDFRNYFNR